MPPPERSAFQEKLQALLKPLRPQLTSLTSLEKRIATLNDSFFQQWKFTFDQGDPEGQNPANVDLLQVFQRRKGFCLSLSLLYLWIGTELGLPLSGVKAPGHFFLRCQDPREKRFFNIETTNQGLPLANSYYLERYQIEPKALVLEYYLRNLSPQEVLAEYLSNYLALLPPPQGLSSLELYELAATLSPFSPEIQLNCASASYEAGKLSEALIQYQRVLDLQPQNLEAYAQRGVVYARLGQLSQALEDFAVALQHNPHHQSSLWNRALVYHKNAQIPQAQQDYLQLLKIYPQHAGAHYHLALLYFEQKQFALAEQYAVSALNLEPQNSKYRQFLQEIYASRQQTSRF
jgi:regulator of sirC expression with transglutaminase-like and TPR domain